MPITIFPHEDFEGLSGQLIGEISGLAAKIKPYPVVVPSIPFSDHLQLEIAKKRGICMGIEFLTPSGFLAQTIGKEHGNPWAVDQLHWKILPHAKSYAVKLGMDPEKTGIRDLFAVSGLLADRFDQYAHFRPEIIRQWNQGLPCLPESVSKNDPIISRNEIWQRELWNTLRQEIGSGAPHPALALESIACDRIVLERIVRDFPSITVLGTGSIDPLLVEVLQILAKAGCNIHLHVLLPTMEFLGDLHRRKALPSPHLDSGEFTPDTGHPLLRSMGRHAVGSFLLLGELDEQYTNWPVSSATEHPCENFSLLNRLQSGIRTLTLPTAGGIDSADISIRVHSCYGPRREMEVLRDELLRAFDEIPDLKPHDIHVITPSLETYAPLVSAVLEQITHEENPSSPSPSVDTPLKVRITELSRSDQDQVTLGLLSLLEMAVGGRYEASWVMELLQLAAVQKSLGIPADERGLEQVRGWIKESGLTQGFKEEGGIPKPGSWAFARARLIAGSWLGDLRGLQYPQHEEYVLPVAQELGGESRLLARFIAWLDCLEGTLSLWKENRIPSEWGRLLETAASELLGSMDGDDLKIRPHLLFLKNLPCAEQVDAGSILDWLEGEGGEGRSRAPNSGKITFGRFKQLQNIPCRVLAMVGMKEGSFPGQSRIPAWDLLQHSPRIWDRNLRIDDRQLFLDALLTPEERLIITAPTRNIRNNNEEPFSSCVDELLRVLVGLGAELSHLVIQHRLQPFSPDYFHEGSRLPRSFSVSHAKVASEISESTEKKPLPFWKKTPATIDPEPIDIEITLTQLTKFWENPAKAFLKEQGIPLWSDDEDDEALDRAPFALNSLDSWKIREAILQEVAFGEGDLELTKARLTANRMLPPGSLGTIAFYNEKIPLLRGNCSKIGSPAGNKGPR